MYSRTTLSKVRVYEIDYESSGAIASNENCIAFTRQDSKDLQVVVGLSHSSLLIHDIE